jgi:transposase
MTSWGETRCAMPKRFPSTFKQKMVERLTGNEAVSAKQLARETGVYQPNLSRWLREARSLPVVADKSSPFARERTVEYKARVLADAAKLDGEALAAYLEREGVTLAEYERWRAALDESAPRATLSNRRIRQLERELARKEKALAEAAALFILKKKVDALYGEDEDDDTDETNEK